MEVDEVEAGVGVGEVAAAAAAAAEEEVLSKFNLLVLLAQKVQILTQEDESSCRSCRALRCRGRPGS